MYCSVSDMQKLFPLSMLINLSNDVQAQTTVNQANIDEAIDQADREIDGYLAIAMISVPMDPVPPLINNISTKMAIWNLHLRKLWKDVIWEDTYKIQQGLLEKIATGRIKIGQLQSGIPALASSRACVSTRARKFTTDVMGTF